MNKGLLFIFVFIMSLMPLILSFCIVFCFAMLAMGIDYTVLCLNQPIVYGLGGIYLAWRIHKNYVRLKKIIIEDTDKFNEILEKYRDQQFKDKYGR